jgi:hypothetical protein
LKAGFAVGAVAKGLVLRVTTAAESNRGPTGQVKWAPARVANRELAFHSDGAVVVDDDFRQTILLIEKNSTLFNNPYRRGLQGIRNSHKSRQL